MREPDRPSMSDLLAKPKQLEAAVCRAVREATLLHARLGHPVAALRNGQVVWLQPKEVFDLLAATSAEGDERTE